jgi:hypothetical protein
MLVMIFGIHIILQESEAQNRSLVSGIHVYRGAGPHGYKLECQPLQPQHATLGGIG